MTFNVKISISIGIPLKRVLWNDGVMLIMIEPLSPTLTHTSFLTQKLSLVLWSQFLVT